MRKKILISVLTVNYILYTYAIITHNNRMGDIISPILMLLVSYIIFYGFVIQQRVSILKWFGWMLTLSAFSWFLCDFWWGIQTLVLHSDAEENFITVYGYSMTNIFLFLSAIFTTFYGFKQINRIQAMLDTLIISICISVLLWLFVFKQNSDNVILLLSDPISMANIVIDIVMFALINVWTFSTRLNRSLIYHRILVTGELVYVITDLIYYYIFFYLDYKPNSWIDGAYMVSFGLMAGSCFFKSDEKSELIRKQTEKRICCKLGVEIYILCAPLIVLIFKRSQMQYFLLLVVALLIYYVLINYTQQSIFQGKLLELEKMNVSDLEKQVEERTEEITKILNTDFVSGLYNRRFFETKLFETMNNIREDELIALLYIDLNKSKAIKYLYGKDTAENLLKNEAEAFNQIVSENDGMIAAYGDDAFVIMVNSYHADIVAEKIALQLIARCNELFFVHDHEIRVTLNIGISCYPRDTLDQNNLIKNADIAMMQARAKGFNHIQNYSDYIGNLTYNRNRIELKLKKVKFNKEFLLYYQPQVYCSNGTLCGFETLLRWYDEDKNFISPLDFIPVVEENGMIVPLGYWIIENAAKQYAIWKEETGNDYRISVNVSSKQLVEADFVQKLEDILKEYNVKPELFEVEITESQQIENSINIQETLNEIKKLGISIAIDDFGTGYSSLYYIKNIPADRIKIAKELIDNLESDLYTNAIIQMVISAAKVKGIKVIAEGVETKEQWECLKKLGCDEIQGYYFAKPMSAEELNKIWIS